MMNELLSPLIKRAINILLRNNIIPEPPQNLGKVKIEYVSPLAKAQKFSQIAPINNFLMSMVNMAGVDPKVLDNLDTDIATRELSDMYGVIPKIIRDFKVVQQIREERSQEQQEQAALSQGLQAAEMASGAAKNMAQAQKAIAPYAV
jgi:hypothetical protein